MERLLSVLVLGSALMIPVRTDGIFTGGNLCKGQKTTKACTAAKAGVTCISLTGAFMCAPEGCRTQKIAAQSLCCAKTNCTANCCGSANGTSCACCKN
jgi:hypothetical protein